MATKIQQDNEPSSQYQPLASPKRILQTIYGSKYRRNSKQLTPLNTSATKNTNPITSSNDYYTFQRALTGAKFNKQPNPEKFVERARKTFSLSRPSKPDILPSSNSRARLTNAPQGTPRSSISQQKNSASSNRLTMNNNMHSTATGFNQASRSQIPITKPKVMSNTTMNFRPPTNSYMRKNNNEAEDHNNYLTKYEIIKQLGKGTYGVVHLARKKADKPKLSARVDPNEDSFLFAYGTLRKSIQKENDQQKQFSQQISQSKVLRQSIQSQKPSQKQQSKSIQSISMRPDTNLNNVQVRISQDKILPPIRSQSPQLTPKQHKQQQKHQQIKKQQQIDSNQQLYAIKIYQKFKMNKDPTKFKNIRKQINIMQNIQHPHIIKLYQTVQTLTKISLVVQYGGKQSLLDYLKQNYPLSQAIMRKIGKQLVSALVYLHEKNIVHRDIKLQNILMLNQDVKIIDFGFSTLTFKNRKLNAICGTPNYMAPEVLSKKQYIGQLADVWSFGVVMFTIAQGRHPFKAQTYNQLQRLVNKCNYQFKRITNPVHQAFIKRILKVKPQDRPRAIDLMNHPWLIMQQSQNIEQSKK